MSSIFPAPNLYTSFQPDSQAHFSAHPEFGTLIENFWRYNTGNNAGDLPRLWSFILNCKQVIADQIPGQFAELGVWRGNTAAVLAHYAARSGRRVQLFDTFEGFDEKDIREFEKKACTPGEFRDTSIELVKEVIGADAAVCDFVKGRFPMSLMDVHRASTYAIVSLDCDLYEPMIAGLNFFYPRTSNGGIFFLHDYSSLYWPGSKQAIDEFCKATGEHIVLMPDKSGSAFLRKSISNSITR